MRKKTLKSILLVSIGLSLNFCNHEKAVRGPIDPSEQANAYEIREASPKQPPVYREEKTVDRVVEEQKWRNESLASERTSLFETLEDCHRYLVDPRLGGNYETFALPQFEKNEEGPSEEMGYNKNGEYTVSRTESYEDLLAREQRKQKKLEREISLIKNSFKTCKAMLTEARLRHGLPAEKYPAIVTKTPSGGLKVLVPAERNLDDAFERKLIKAKYDN
jgi:hypothetical protein